MEIFGLTKVRYPQYMGYDEYLDSDGNKVYWDKKAQIGVKCFNTDLPMGAKVSLPRQVEAQETYKERGKQIAKMNAVSKQTREYNRIQSFYFCLSKDRREDKISPQALARLFFAASFLRLNDDRLYSPDGSLLTKLGLRDLMRLKYNAFREFWHEVADRYIFEMDDASLKISGEFFRGVLSDHRKAIGQGDEYQQVFIQSLRELFWQTDVKKHRYLGFLFMILHQINWEYNILCWNPEEKDRDKVKPMSLDEFCRSMGTEGHTENQKQRLLDAFRALKFNVGKTRQYVCAYLEDHVSGNFHLIVNPNLLYRGHDRSKVDGFGTFFPNLST